MKVNVFENYKTIFNFLSFLWFQPNYFYRLSISLTQFQIYKLKFIKLIDIDCKRNFE